MDRFCPLGGREAQHQELADNLLPVLRPLVAQLQALTQTNRELQERCHALEVRVLDVETRMVATYADR